jgi:type IV pilus assembly protein PilX
MSEHTMNSHYKTIIADGLYQMQHANKQRGVVLFIALIALVVMSLAAVALIRSVDTSTIIAGNLASKQAATASADSGLETALSWMAAIPTPATLDVSNATSGYYATQDADPTTFTWDATDSRLATGANIIAGTDTSGNTIRYVIQRMCRTAGAPSPGGCLFGAPVVGSNSQAVVDETGAGAVTSTEQSPLYRVTARVVGVKNTISFIQAFVY